MDSAGARIPAASRQLGTIKWFNAKKGFGFISPDLDDIPFTIDLVARGNQASSSGGGADNAAARRPAAPADVFMHKSTLQPGTSTKDAARVEFELGLDKRGRKVAIRCAACSLCLNQACWPGAYGAFNARCCALHYSVWSSAMVGPLHHRQWVAADFQQLKSLHEDWFPVRYPDAYWRQACERHLSLEGWPLLTLTSYTPGDAARIVGCISAVIMDIDACTGLDPATITGATGEPAETALYLKTLGVREEARRHGRALELVTACELYAREVSLILTRWAVLCPGVCTAKKNSASHIALLCARSIHAYRSRLHV